MPIRALIELRKSKEIKFWQHRGSSDNSLDLIYQEASMSKNKPPKMAFTRKPCVIATGFALSLMAAQSYAQTPAPAPAAATEKVEKIEVTGSRIPSANLESTSPITTIDAAAIKIDGLRSTESLLNNLPQVFADQGGTVVNGATGTAGRHPDCHAG